MMPSDDEGDLAEAGRIFDGRSPAQFWDPERRVGWAFQRLLWPQRDRPIWDAYLFFDRAATWSGEAPPRPKEQLGQYRIGGATTVIGGIDETGEPTPLGPASMLEQLLGERFVRLPL